MHGQQRTHSWILHGRLFHASGSPSIWLGWWVLQGRIAGPGPAEEGSQESAVELVGREGPGGRRQRPAQVDLQGEAVRGFREQEKGSCAVSSYDVQVRLVC